MGHSIYLVTEQWGQLMFIRFPMWAFKPASHFYCVYDAKHCFGGCSGTGESISLNRRDLKAIRIQYACYLSQDWGFDETESTMAMQIDDSLRAIENYFDSTPPVLADETYFLIKQLAVPEGIAKRIAAYASTDSAEVSIDFR